MCKDFRILKWHLPVIGEVPMMFYFVNCNKPEEIEMKKMIEENGGLVVDQYGCFTFQIKTEHPIKRS